jgi:hypothetical protein
MCAYSIYAWFQSSSTRQDLLNVLKNFKYVNFILKNMQQVCCNPFIVFREWSITHSDNLQTWNNYIFLGVLPSFRKCYNTRIQYSQRHTIINHCDRRITHLSDTDISFVLSNISSKFLICTHKGHMPYGDQAQWFQITIEAVMFVW